MMYEMLCTNNKRTVGHRLSDGHGTKRTSDN